MSPRAHPGKSGPHRSGAGPRPLQQHRLVRQLVVAGTRAGAMPAEERPHPEDSDHRALAETPLAIVVLHLLANRIPLGLRNPRRDAAVGDYLDRVIRHEHVDQHPIVVLGVPDAELAEQLQGARARRELAPQLRQIERRLHDEADLPSVPRFALTDRLLDGIASGLRKVAARAPARGRDMTQVTPENHRRLPASGGAAAGDPPASTAETAAATAEAAPSETAPAATKPARARIAGPA